MNEDKLKYDYKYINRWANGLTSSVISDYMVAINPDCRIKELAAEMATFDPDPEGLNSGKLSLSESCDVYTFIGNKKISPCGSEEELKQAMKHIANLKAEIDKVLQSPDIDKYPGIRSVLNHFSELTQRALDGRDIANELVMSPAGEYHANLWVDFVNTEHGGSSMEEVDRMIQDLHYEEIGKTVLDNMDCIHELKSDKLTVNERATIKNRMKNNAQNISNEAKYLREPKTVEKYEKMFHDAQVNVAGDRGIGAHGKVADLELEAMDKGWDVKYARDYENIKWMAEICSRTDTFFEKSGSKAVLSDFKNKANALAKLDPTNKAFGSQQAFVEYFQSFADAANELLKESQKPEVQQALKEIAKENDKTEKGFKAKKRELEDERRNLQKEQEAIQKGNGTKKPEEVEQRLNEIKKELKDLNDKLEPESNNVFSALYNKPGANFEIGLLAYYGQRGNFKAQNLDANTLSGTRIDYEFLKSAAKNVGGKDLNHLGPYRSIIGEKFFTDERDRMAMLMGFSPNQDLSNIHGPIETDIYSGEAVIHANTQAQKEATANDIDMLLADYKEIMDNPDMQKYKGIRRYLQVSVNMLEAAKKGINRSSYMNKVPGGDRIIYQTDWVNTDISTGKPFTPEDYEEMISGMKFDRMYDLQERLCNIQIEMDGKHLTPEERAAYGKEIFEINSELIAIHEHQMSDESKEKYSKFYQDFGSPNHGNVSGSRGYHGTVRQLREQNAMLEAGWDPAKIADYEVMRMCAKECQQVADRLNEINDPALAVTRERLQKVGELNPEGRHFENQREYNTYSMRYSMALKDLYAELGKPEIQNKLYRYQDAHNDLKPFVRTGNEMGRRGSGSVYQRYEALAKQTDITILPANTPQEARNEAAAIKNELLQERYREEITARWDKAKERFEKLNNPDASERTDSKEYENMKSALEEVAKLPAETDIEKIRQALGKANSAEKSYESFKKIAEGVDKYKDGIESVRQKAREKLEQLKALDDGNKSKYFEDMKTSLEELTVIPKGASLDDVNAAIKNVKEAAENYVDNRSGFRFTKRGRTRQQAAIDIFDFAKEEKKEITAAAANTVVENSPSMSTLELLEGQTQAMEVLRESDAGIGTLLAEDLERSNEALQSPEPKVVGKDALGKKRKADFKKFQEEGLNMNQEEYANSLSRVIAGISLQMMVDKGKLSPKNAAEELKNAAEELRGSAHFKNMVEEVMNTPKMREEMGGLEPGELFAKMAHKRLGFNMASKKAKKEASKEKTNDLTNKAENKKGMVKTA